MPACLRARAARATVSATYGFGMFPAAARGHHLVRSARSHMPTTTPRDDAICLPSHRLRGCARSIAKRAIDTGANAPSIAVEAHEGFFPSPPQQRARGRLVSFGDSPCHSTAKVGGRADTLYLLTYTCASS